MSNEFKIWDKQGQNMFGGTFFWNKLPNMLFPDNYTVLQWTGAIGKNKTKIFEGDIVLWDNPDPYDWDRDTLTMVVGYNNRVMGYMLYDFPEDVGDKAGRHFFPEEVEVVGNVFEGATKDGVDYGSWRLKQ